MYLGGNSLPQRPIQALIAVEKDNDSDALPGGELKWGCSRNTLSLAMATYSWMYLDKTVCMGFERISDHYWHQFCFNFLQVCT